MTANVPPWMMSAADLGLNLKHAVHVPTYVELDTIARRAGLVGGTFATGEPGYGARMAYLESGGNLYVAPAIRYVSSGIWPNPGEQPTRLRTAAEQHGDDAADQWERARDRDALRPII